MYLCISRILSQIIIEFISTISYRICLLDHQFVLLINWCYVYYHIKDTRRHFLRRATIQSSILSGPVPINFLKRHFIPLIDLIYKIKNLIYKLHMETHSVVGKVSLSFKTNGLPVSHNFM